MAKTKTRRMTHNAAETEAALAADADAETKATAEGPKVLRALLNIPAEVAGTPKRVFRGQVFEAAPERVHDLTKRRKIAEVAK